jgi:hypothetical protein
MLQQPVLSDPWFRPEGRPPSSVQLTPAGGRQLLERASSIGAPTILLDGGASPPWMHEGSNMLARALPNGRHRTLEGQTHDVKPVLLATAVEGFLRA